MKNEIWKIDSAADALAPTTSRKAGMIVLHEKARRALPFAAGFSLVAYLR
jgi:hypothetical protein